MAAIEAQSDAGCVLQMKLQRTRSRVWDLRPFSCGFGEMRIQQSEHIPGPGLTQQNIAVCQGDLQSLSRLRDHAPMNPPETTTPLRATTSSRMRCASVEIPTSAALAIFSFSIAVADSGSVPPKFRTVGTVDRHRLRRPPALKVRADPPLETPDIVPSPIVFARPSH